MSQPSSTSFLPVLGPSTFGDSRATPSLLPTWNPTWNHRTPGDIAMVGVESNEDQLVSQYMNMDNNEAALEGNENVGDGIGRRPGKEIAGSGSHSRNVSVDCYGDGKSSTGVVSTNPPNSSVNSRLFTDNEMKMIMADEKLKKLAITSPKDAKRMISNRESAARSKMKKAQQLFDLNTENATLRAQNNQLQANYNQLQSDYSALENQMREMMIHNQGLLETGRIKDELIEQHRRDSEGMSMQLQQLQQLQSLDMVQQLNTNHLRNQDFDGNI
ncbi:hypothetical protein AALP_AA8G417300 [Arabis alpina]|uniref:BZIP domain-containing protein n=1 Tax=Arabis alpina TaxID=50452 RepID=A0A087GCV1_ARAAL|nr:hypothetical protein AALP_AA8G417300 [Arabis alpina]